MLSSLNRPKIRLGNWTGCSKIIWMALKFSSSHALMTLPEPVAVSGLTVFTVQSISYWPPR